MSSDTKCYTVPCCYLEMRPVWHARSIGGGGGGSGGHEAWSVCFSPDGALFACCMRFGEVKVLPWNMLTPRSDPVHISEGKTLQCEAGVWSMAFGPRLSVQESARRRLTDGEKLLLATGLDDGTIKVWLVATAQLQWHLCGHSSLVRNLTFVPNGNLTLVSASRDKTLAIWDLPSKDKPSHVLTGPDNWIIKCAVSPDSSMVASVCNYDTKAYIWSLRSCSFIRNLKYEEQRCMSDCEFSKDGALLAISSFHLSTGWWMDLWDPYTAESLSRIESCDLCPHQDMLTALCFSPVNFQVALKDNRALQIWDMEQDRRVLKSENNKTSSLCCTFHPHGGAIVTGHRDGSVKFWQAPCLVPSLQHLCRTVLRYSVSTFQVMALPLPKKTAEYLTYRNLTKNTVLRCHEHCI